MDNGPQHEALRNNNNNKQQQPLFLLNLHFNILTLTYQIEKQRFSFSPKMMVKWPICVLGENASVSNFVSVCLQPREIEIFRTVKTANWPPF